METKRINALDRELYNQTGKILEWMDFENMWERGTENVERMKSILDRYKGQGDEGYTDPFINIYARQVQAQQQYQAITMGQHNE